MFAEIAREVAYESGAVSLEEITFSDAAGRFFKRILLRLSGNSVLIVPRDDTGRFFLNNQLRPGIPEATLEFPSGGIQDDEDAEAAARRELAEEMGMSGELHFVGVFRPMIGVVAMDVSVFVCEHAKRTVDGQSLEIHEMIETVTLTHEQILDAIRDGSLNDGFALSALMLIDACYAS